MDSRAPSFALVVVVAALAGVAVASTPYTLINKNHISVSDATVKCFNGQLAKVTTKISGELHATSGTRTDFKGDKWKNRMALMDRVADDERGHVVASMFGGPITEWNMVPMHRSVNRKITAQSSLLNRWDEFEKWTRQQLDAKKGPVKFEITIKYGPRNGCRPINFAIRASAKGSPGFQADFDNGPYGSFGVVSQPSRPKKKPKTKK